MFSSRLPARLTPNDVSRAVAARREAGASLIDLTETNPTRVGLAFAPGVLSALADPRGETYQPEPLGLEEARAAVAADYERRGLSVRPDRVVLTASTSDAYGLLFKLLCDPGDEVLVPQPSYPLFELLTGLDGVPARPYQLEYHGAWSIDHANVTAAIGPRTRAVLIVSPNNPTGSMLRRDDREWLVEVCAAKHLALVVDEVFADYPLGPKPDACSLVGESRVLTFSLGGLSKAAGLPQVKLGWIVVDGPDADAARAIERLGMICDTYLSVSTPVQVAAPALIDAGRDRRLAIAGRIEENLRALRTAVRKHPAVTLFEPEAGWSAVLQVPAVRSEEALVIDLLDRAGVIVHPGYFFDFARAAFLVVSLLPEPGVFNEGLARVLPIASGESR